MSIEVCNPYGSSWRVYFTLDPNEVAEAPCWGEYVIAWDTWFFADAEERAHRLAKRMRLPGGYKLALAHFTTVSDDPLVRACGCGENEDGLFVNDPNCLIVAATSVD